MDLCKNVTSGWEIGNLSTSSGGTITDNNTIRFIDYFDIGYNSFYVVAKSLYDTTYTTNIQYVTGKVYFYDSDKVFLSYVEFNNNTLVSIPTSAKYTKLVLNTSLDYLIYCHIFNNVEVILPMEEEVSTQNKIYMVESQSGYIKNYTYTINKIGISYVVNENIETINLTV